MLCPEFGKELEKRSLVAYRLTQNVVAKGRLGQEGDKEAGGNAPRTYMISFPIKAGPRSYPVEGCSG